MKKLTKLLCIALCVTLFTVGCEKDSAPRNSTSIIPATTNGRENITLGTEYLNERKITVSVWDHGQIDGDIITIYVNGTKHVTNRKLAGPGGKITFTTTLKYKGYNYILLYAHNVGNIPPNTAAISITSGGVSKEFTLNANLDENGAVNLVVE